MEPCLIAVPTAPTNARSPQAVALRLHTIVFFPHNVLATRPYHGT